MAGGESARAGGPAGPLTTILVHLSREGQILHRLLQHPTMHCSVCLHPTDAVTNKNLARWDGWDCDGAVRVCRAWPRKAEEEHRFCFPFSAWAIWEKDPL